MGIDITFGKRYIGYTLIDQYQNWNQQNIFKEHRTGKVQRIKANYKIASLVEKKKINLLTIRKAPPIISIFSMGSIFSGTGQWNSATYYACWTI